MRVYARTNTLLWSFMASALEWIQGRQWAGDRVLTSHLPLPEYNWQYANVLDEGTWQVEIGVVRVALGVPRLSPA